MIPRGLIHTPLPWLPTPPNWPLPPTVFLWALELFDTPARDLISVVPFCIEAKNYRRYYFTVSIFCFLGGGGGAWVKFTQTNGAGYFWTILSHTVPLDHKWFYIFVLPCCKSPLFSLLGGGPCSSCLLFKRYLLYREI